MFQTQNVQLEQKLAIMLLMLRLSIGLVFFMWAIDKFVEAEHAINIMKGVYGIPFGSEALVYAMGIGQLVLTLAFIAGIKKDISYLLVLIFHGMTTLASFPFYLEPIKHLVFFTSWPMFAACCGLYMLREYDVLWTFKGSKKASMA